MSVDAEKSRWQAEFDALPEWGKNLVRGISNSPLHGGGHEEQILMHLSNKKPYEGFFVGLDKKNSKAWWDGFWGLQELAKALTAPWPPQEPPPHETMRSTNIVELLDDDEESGFDQPCHFGYRVAGHAVYCHNDAWTDSPRKCRRGADDYLHEDCPGFVPLKQKSPDQPKPIRAANHPVGGQSDG